MGDRSPLRPVRRARAAAATAALALALAGCAPMFPFGEQPDEQAPTTPGETAQGQPAPGAAEGVPELVREIAPSTVSVEVTIGQAGQQAQGAGSGVIWDAQGHIVTNAHVVAGADEVIVVLADGERHEAEVVATDERIDLAVLKIPAEGLPAAEFSDELPQLGELAVAVGNPLGFQNTVTAGIVSGLDRALPPEPEGPVLAGLIQTDAAISSGSSGGALVDGDGTVIGINVVAAGDPPGGSGVVQGIAFAIPSTTVVPAVEQLIETGEVAHAYLGIAGADLTPQLVDRFGIDRESGVLVGQVEPDGPADEAGLRQGDVLVELEGRELQGLGDLLGALRELSPGDTVDLTVVSDGEEEQVSATLSEPPEDR